MKPSDMPAHRAPPPTGDRLVWTTTTPRKRCAAPDTAISNDCNNSLRTCSGQSQKKDIMTEQTDQPTIREEIAVRTGRIRAIYAARAVAAHDAEAADLIYRGAVENECADQLTAGAIAMLLATCRALSEVSGSTVDDILEFLMDAESGAVATLADIDLLGGDQ